MPLRQDEVNRLLGIEAPVSEESPKEEIPFLIGQVVEIIEGPFSDFSGSVEEILPDKGRSGYRFRCSVVRPASSSTTCS